MADVGSLLTLISPRAQAAWIELVDVLAAAGPAPCALSDPEYWWTISREHAAAAVAGCHLCPARAQCLAYAVAADERHGVWGGLLPEERRQLNRPAALGQDSTGPHRLRMGEAQ